MLRRFSVENYRNFEKKATLDFASVRDYKFNTECLTGSGLLGKAILLGKNGSGKTNLGFALFDIVFTLTDNAVTMEFLDPSSFINGNGSSDAASFSYEFQCGESVAVYEYRKTAPSYIVYEKLVIDGDTIFERDLSGDAPRSDMSGLDLVNAGNLKTDDVGRTLSMLRYIANNTSQAPGSPVSMIMDYVRRMLYFRSVQDGNTYIGYMKGMENLDQFIMNNGYVKDFQRFLREVADLDMNLNAVDVKGMQKVFVQSLRTKSLEFSRVASSGTRALELFYYWSKKFDDVSLLFIDEFDAFYHYELSEQIVKRLMVHRDMQTVLTTHNTFVVKNDIMRADCYLQIIDGRIQSFSESTDREIREGHNLEKMLRNGEFDE